MILGLRTLSDKTTLIPSVLGPRTWSLAHAGGPSQGEPRKSETQAPLPTRAADATCFDNPTAGRSFFPLSAVSPPTLDASALFRPRPRHLPLAGSQFAHAGRRPFRLSTLGGDTTAPPFSTQVEGELRYREYEKEYGTEKAPASVKHRVAKIHVNRILKLDRAEKQDEPAPEVDPSELPADEPTA